MSYYTLINNRTGERHEFDFENISDIKSALEHIHKFNNRVYPYDRVYWEGTSGSGKQITRRKLEKIKIMTWECFEDTMKRMKKVSIPVTSY